MLNRLLGFFGSFFNRWRSGSVDHGIDLDKAARSFIEDQTDCGPKRVREFVQDLDANRLERMAKEVDPLEGATEIHPDSVIAINADIPHNGAPCQYIKNPTPSPTILPDRIRSVNCDIRIVRNTVGKDTKDSDGG